jgi:hypothetical protein
MVDSRSMEAGRYRKKATKRLCHMCNEVENAKHVILCCGENAGWRINLQYKGKAAPQHTYGGIEGGRCLPPTNS